MSNTLIQEQAQARNIDSKYRSVGFDNCSFAAQQEFYNKIGTWRTSEGVRLMDKADIGQVGASTAAPNRFERTISVDGGADAALADKLDRDRGQVSRASHAGGGRGGGDESRRLVLETAMNAATSAPRDLWFLNTRVTVRVSCVEGTDKISIMEHWAPHGDSPPLHIHRNEDEVFHCLEGDARFVVGGREARATAGQTLIVAKGIAHTYRVESLAGARWLTVTCGEDFERFVRAFSRPAERDGLPEPSGPPTPDQAQELARACAQFGIEIVGPPLS